MAILSKKYPSAVISGHSAYYYYNLTDIIPRETVVCTNRNATRIHNDKIKQIRMQDELYKLGITTMEYEGVIIIFTTKKDCLLILLEIKIIWGMIYIRK